MKILLEQIIKLLWLFPIKKNRIVFRSSQGTSYSCNPKYISEYLATNYPGTFDLVWLFKNPSKYISLKNKSYTVCMEHSILGLYYLITAKILIDNHGVQSYIPVRKAQIVINTWHGGGSYKKPYTAHTKEHNAYIKRMNEKTTKYVSSCRRFSECNLSGTNQRHPEKIMPIGMPRNDLFFQNRPELIRIVKARLGIREDIGIILYAPTFRDNMQEEYRLDEKRIIEACRVRFGGEYMIVFRSHRFSKNRIKDTFFSVDASDYEDMQELIYASDIVISDYSSLIWDVSLALKPCLIYASDLKQYMEARDFYTPIAQWPFPLAENMDQLINNILRFDSEKYKEDVRRHHLELGSYETGTACEKMADYIRKETRI